MRRRARPARLTGWSTVPPLALEKRSSAPSCAGGRKWSWLIGGRSSVLRLAAEVSRSAQSSPSS
eukprot:4657664-Alexandrium_andersonii.AAC.1